MPVIEYAPSSDIHEYLHGGEDHEYHARYVYPLGRPRKQVVLANGEVRFRFDRPGGLSSVVILAELAAGALTDMTWEEVEDQPPSGWWGDLEPGSPAFRMERRGPKVELAQGFRYEPPPFRPGHEPPTEPGSRFSIAVEPVERGPPWVILSANGAGFLSFARHVIYLAQEDVPTGARIVYDGPGILDAGSRQLVLERADFPSDVPWAVPPRAKEGG